MDLINNTILTSACKVEQDVGKDLLLVVAKATFSFGLDVPPVLASVQQPIIHEDEYYGAPEDSALRYSSDFSVEKKASDIALVGDVFSAGDSKVDVSLSVGELHAALSVSGDRCWKKKLGFWRLSKPISFDTMPLVYERSFGGCCSDKIEKRNPIGVGFRSHGCRGTPADSIIPNIEFCDDRLRSNKDRPEPAGFGFINPRWLRGDARQAAHPKLIYPGFLKGDERIELCGFFEEGSVSFVLPALSPVCSLQYSDGGIESVGLVVEKLFIDIYEQQVLLVWNGRKDLSSRLYNLTTVRIDH